MTAKEIRKQNRKGIFTITQLSCTFRPPKRSKKAKLKGQPHNAALQALAIRDNKIYVLGTPELPSCSTRIYFDLEGDPERRFVYLLGMIVESSGTEEHHSFWINTRDEEPKLFQQFLAVVDRCTDYCLYSYGSYEAAFLRRMIKESGRPELAERLLQPSLNVLSIIYSHVYFPTYSNSLKDIGKYLGFRWTEVDASGVQSIVWRRKWEATGAATFKEMLTTYNMEDCTALKKVTEFLYATCLAQPSMTHSQTLTHEGHQVSRVEEINPQSSRREWCRAEFAVPDFEFINERAYFDYQRDKVFIRTNKVMKRRLNRRPNRMGQRNL
jgi:predicted RecB family nuclease